jgi:hypothetical protein
MNAYTSNRDNANQIALEASSVATAVLQLVDQFEGIAASFSRPAKVVEESVRKRKTGRRGQTLSGALRRIARS